MSDWKNVQYKDGKMRTSEGGGGGGSSTFAGLDDVSFDNIQNGQVPKYNSETHKWENANESGGGGTVTDVEVDGVSVVNQQGVAEIPAIPTVNVDDVEVNGVSVVNQNKVAQIVSYKEVTQSEYNALPASKESDGILYCIKDALGGVDGFPPLIYSDEEREIGVWRDGKPLYQKSVFIQSLPSSSGAGNYAHNIANIDKIWIYDGFSFNSSDTNKGTQPLNFIRAERAETSYSFGADVNKTNIIMRVGQDRSAISAYVILRYTKTTDVAGSGQWTTNGTPTHHYSTSEQVIGTYIDGKPLYEKSFKIVHTENWTNNKTFSTGITNLEVGWIEQAMFLDYGQNKFQKLPFYQSPDGKVDYMQVSLSSNGSNIILGTDSQWSQNPNRYLFIVIRYTKTTD